MKKIKRFSFNNDGNVRDALPRNKEKGPRYREREHDEDEGTAEGTKASEVNTEWSEV